MTPARDRYANLLNQLKEIIKSAPVDVVITTVDDWKSTHIENLTIEDLKQNEHIRGLLEVLEFYSNGWVKKHPRLNSFGIPEETYVNEAVKSDGGRRARAKLREWGL